MPVQKNNLLCQSAIGNLFKHRSHSIGIYISTTMIDTHVKIRSLEYAETIEPASQPKHFNASRIMGDL